MLEHLKPAPMPKLRSDELKREVRAGITTFLTMSYIIFVNPAILSQAGMPQDGVIFATCVASAVATLIMGLYAGYPFALAPGMGLNAYFTYGVVKGLGYTWQVALGAVFIEGIIFIALTFLGLRRKLVEAIPESIRKATPVGIGLFIAFIGMRDAGFIVGSKETLVTLGNLSSATSVLAALGLFITCALMARRVKGSIFIGIVITTAMGIALGEAELPKRIVSFPNPLPTFMKMDLSGIGQLAFWKAVIAFLFVDMFDTIGSLTAMGILGGFMKGETLERMDQALMSDAVGTVVGAITGTSTVTTYIESSTGIAEGGKTGVTSAVVGVLFLAALFFSPVVKIIPAFATAPALIVVGILMASQAKELPWNDMTEALPAFLTMFTMPLTYSIANGLAAGFISYPAIKLITGRHREVHPIMWILGILFVLRFS